MGGIHGSSGGGGGLLELQLPVVSLQADSQTIEWIGQNTFDFTKYSQCEFVFNGKQNSTIWIQQLTFDGVTTGYYWTRQRNLDAGIIPVEANNESNIQLDDASLSGEGTDFIIHGTIWKNIISGFLHAYVIMQTQKGRQITSVFSSATKLDKMKLLETFADPSRYYLTGSELRVYGRKKQ